MAIFTHHQSYVLLTSPNNGIISYISLFENKYLCKFKGHEKPYNYFQNSITSLALHSDSNTFITLSDDEFLVWDLRDKNCEVFFSTKIGWWLNWRYKPASSYRQCISICNSQSSSRCPVV